MYDVRIMRGAVGDEGSRHEKVASTKRNRKNLVKEVTFGKILARRAREAEWKGLRGHLAVSCSILSFYFLELCLPVEGIDQRSLLGSADSWIPVISPK